MAVTYDRVDLSQINFNLLRHDYTDGHYPGYPIIADWGNDPRAHVAAQVKSSLFKTMAASGLNQMNLYDANNNVIGEITLQYKIEYVTYERVGMFGDEQTSTSGYPEYRNQGHGGDWGVKYIRVSRADIPTYDTVVTVTINGVTETSHFGQWGAIEVADYYGTLDEAWAEAIVCGSDGGPTLTLMSKTTGGTTHYYLEWSMLKGIAYTTPEIDYGFEYTPRDTDLLADNLSFTEHIVQEDGYVNDLQDRFCPRVNAGSVGIYAASYNTIQLLMQGLMECDAGDLLKNVFLGGDGKEYVIGLRWYYGLYDNNNVWLNLNENDTYKVQVGGVFLDVGGAVLQGKKFIGEYATWTSSEMDVPRKHDNYLDYFADYQLYLPYYGFLKLHPNDVVGGKIRVIYNINIVTGMADIIVECKNSRSMQTSYKAYTVNAQIGVDIPYASDVMKTAVASWMQTCGKAFMTGASMGAYGATQEYANAIQSSPKTDIRQTALDSISEGEYHNMAVAERAAMKDAAVSKIKTGLHNAGATAKYTGAQMATAMSQFMTEATPSVSRTGGSNTENGTLDELYPYLVITYPIDLSPADYVDYVGLPACTSVQLSQCTGFTQIAAVKPESMTDAPKYVDEILSLLQAGVYL